MTDDWRLTTDVHSVSHEIDAEPDEPGCRPDRGDAFRPAANRQAAAAEGADAGPGPADEGRRRTAPLRFRRVLPGQMDLRVGRAGGSAWAVWAHNRDHVVQGGRR